MKNKRKLIIVSIFIIILLTLSISLILNKTKANSYQYDGSIINSIEIDKTNNKIKVISSEPNLSYKILDFMGKEEELETLITNIENGKEKIKSNIEKQIEMSKIDRIIECPAFNYRRYYIENFNYLTENVHENVFGIKEDYTIDLNDLYDLGKLNYLKNYYDVCNEEISYIKPIEQHSSNNYIESYITDVLDKNIDYLTKLKDSIYNGENSSKKVVLSYVYIQRYQNEDLKKLVRNQDKFNEFYKNKVYTNFCIENTEELCNVNENSIEINGETALDNLISKLNSEKEKLSCLSISNTQSDESLGKCLDESSVSIDSYNEFYRNFNELYNNISSQYDSINNSSIEILTKLGIINTSDFQSITNSEIPYDFNDSEKHILLVKTVKDEVEYFDFEIIESENSSTGDDNKPSTGDDNKPSTGNDNKPSTGDDNKPSAGDDNKPSAGDDNKPSTGDDNKPSTGDDNKSSTGDDNKPSTEDNDIINPQTGDINIALIIGGIIVSLVVLIVSIVYIIKHRKDKEIR